MECPAENGGGAPPATGPEDLVEVSREVQVSPPELEEWRRVFLETGQQGLRRFGAETLENGS